MVKNIGFGLIVIVVALASVVASELLLTSVWLPNAPMAVTSNLFWLGLLPVQLVIVALTTLLLFKVYKHAPAIYLPLYAASFALLHALELNMLNNPMQDIVQYVLAIALACLLWFGLFIRLTRPAADATAG